jgi:transketolase N-terminal domain/subunit
MEIHSTANEIPVKEGRVWEKIMMNENHHLPRTIWICDVDDFVVTLSPNL